MGNHKRAEIEQLAHGAYSLALERIIEKYAAKQTQVLNKVRLKGNSGGYLPALTRWAAKRARSMILALADAYVDAFTVGNAPSDKKAETLIEGAAQQIAAGTISAVREHRLIRQDSGIHLCHIEIERSVKSALKEGLLRLRRQRAQVETFKSRDSSPAKSIHDVPEESDHISYLKAPDFVYKYPSDFPASEQLAIEEAREEANVQLEGKAVLSYDEHRKARMEWFWHLLSAAATAIGRIGSIEQWDLNRRREMLIDLGAKAAEAIRLVGRDRQQFESLRASRKWRQLDQALLGPALQKRKLAASDSNIESRKATAEKTHNRGNVEILRDSNGNLKRVVNLKEASRYGGVTRRAIEKAAKKGSLDSEGQGPNRRIVVSSLIKYFPPEK